MKPHNRPFGPRENMQTGLRPMKLKPTSPAAREGSGVSPPLVRGGVSAADRRGVLWYARTVGQFVSCVTFGRRARANTTGEGTALFFGFQEKFQNQ